MKLTIALRFLLGLCVVPSIAQTPQKESDAPMQVFPLGSGVTSPELLPHAATKPYVADHCRGDEQGTVTFSVIVDADGVPRNIYFLNPLSDDLDALALRHAIEDRFKPGTKDGKSVTVAASLELSLRTCLRDERDSTGKAQIVLHLATEPQLRLLPPVDPPASVVLVSGTGLSNNPSNQEAEIYKVGGDVTSPIPFPPAGSTAMLTGQVLGRGDYKVSILVDRYGMPASFRILETEPGREKQLSGIIRLRRFKPALMKGQPVPARFELALHFH